MSGTVRVGVLGPLVVRTGGHAVALPRSDVVRGLLSGLLLARGEPLSVPRLTAMVWWDRAERTRPGSVHVGLNRLRGWLEGIGLPVTVLREGPGYRLEHAAEVDLDRLADARPAGSARERCVQLGDMLRDYRGAVLADTTRLSRSDPLVIAAERLVRRRCLELADAAEAAREPERAVAPLQTCAAADPYDEVVQARLVELLAAAERPAAALRHYESVRRRLHRELGVRPSARLHRAGASCRLAGAGAPTRPVTPRR